MFWVVSAGVYVLAAWCYGYSELSKYEKEIFHEELRAFLVGALKLLVFTVGVLKLLVFIVVEIAKFVWKIFLQLWAFYCSDGNERGEQLRALPVGALKLLVFIVVEIAKFVWKILLQLWAFYLSDGNERGYYEEPQKNHQHYQETPRRAASPVSRRPESRDYRFRGTSISYSNPRNNHDDVKYKHSSRELAEAEARRMQAGESRRVNAYYNRELNGWYVGRSKGGY
jgi:hypothetical protein